MIEQTAKWFAKHLCKFGQAGDWEFSEKIPPRRFYCDLCMKRIPWKRL